MADPVAYSVKVDPNELEGAKKFFARRGLLLQNVLRGLIRLAGDCEQCLALVDAKATTSEIQSSLASTLAEAKELWQLNGLFQETVLKMAEITNVPKDFIINVLAQAQQVGRQAPK
jgi:hypothetical protein